MPAPPGWQTSKKSTSRAQPSREVVASNPGALIESVCPWDWSLPVQSEGSALARCTCGWVGLTNGDGSDKPGGSVYRRAPGREHMAVRTVSTIKASRTEYTSNIGNFQGGCVKLLPGFHGPEDG